MQHKSTEFVNLIKRRQNIEMKLASEISMQESRRSLISIIREDTEAEQMTGETLETKFTPIPRMNQL